jgi:glycerol-3-phosphate dehydrogenase (NAD(P)+)
MPEAAHDRPAAAAIAVLGAGAWGTVVAQLLAHNGHAVRLWARSAAVAETLQRTRRCEALAESALHAGVTPTSDLTRALDGAVAAFVAVPCRAYASLVDDLVRAPRVAALVSCAKGFLDADLRRPSEALAAAAPRVAVLSGPNLAGEIALGLPAAATVASDQDDLAVRAQRWLSQPSFRVYRSRDPIGVEASGALKNVIALAAGMSDELGLGENTHAALLTRGLAELARLGRALGGDPRTFYGLAGVGDLIATCASPRSRNHQVGARVARGEGIAAIEASGVTAEGVPTVRHVVRFAAAHGLDLPICREVEAVIDRGRPPREAIHALMTRTAKGE